MSHRTRTAPGKENLEGLYGSSRAIFENYGSVRTIERKMPVSIADSVETTLEAFLPRRAAIEAGKATELDRVSHSFQRSPKFGTEQELYS
jgi:hypothetical protein